MSLLTFTPRAIAFYKTLGFAIVANRDHDTFRCTLMLWTPASLSA